MIVRIRLFALLALFLFLLGLMPLPDGLRARAAAATRPPGPARMHAVVRVFFIGNSQTYFNDLPRAFESLASGANLRVRVEADGEMVGNESLAGHWARGRAAARLAASHWDYVVLQEHSGVVASDPDSLVDHARRFDALIQRGGGTTVLFEAGRVSEPDAQPWFTRSVAWAGSSLGMRIAPVGTAWATVARRDPSVELRAADGAHPSALATALAATVILETIFGAAIAPNAYSWAETPDTFWDFLTPPTHSVDAEHAALFAKVASEAAATAHAE